MCTQKITVEMMDSKKSLKVKKNEKIPKGYRLKVSTHDKIKEIQNITNSSLDMVITRAVRIYMKQLINK
jgi:hypothetical protein